MQFTSFQYLLFLPLVALVLYIIPGRIQWLWLLISSIVFYYLLLPSYLIVFVSLILLNFYLGQLIENSPKRKSILVYGIFINLVVLGFFKYFGYIQSIINDIKEISAEEKILKLILPVGLSFIIFTVLSYLIEIQRGTLKAERHIGIFASSLLFFPKIMQGPIEKPANINHQFREVKIFDYNLIAEGLKLILWGYFKKLVVANRLALYVDAVYDNYGKHSGFSLLLATIFYSFQIYADFSGYTDIALGSAKVLGVKLTNNFNRPFFASSIKEFWNRWHISLSVWLRDYLFMPLAVFFAGVMKRQKFIGMPVEKWIFMLATIITFSVCGIWHGEGLNFLIWGLIFGIYLVTANWMMATNKKIRKHLHITQKSFSYRIYSVIITFILVSFSWIFFRSADTHTALNIIEKIFSTPGPLFIDRTTMIYGIAGVILLFAVDLRNENGVNSSLPFNCRFCFAEHIMYTLLTIIILTFGVFDGGQFIYFQF